MRGFLHLVQDRRNRAAARELPPRDVLRIAPDQADVRRAFRRARTAGRVMLTQDEAMAVLAAYGVPTVPSRPAVGGEEAAYAASLLGFPVVLKRRRADRPDPPPRWPRPRPARHRAGARRGGDAGAPPGRPHRGRRAEDRVSSSSARSAGPASC